MSMDRLASILRIWAVIVALAYLSVIMLVFVILFLQRDYWDLAKALLLVSPAVVAVAAFVWGLVVWNTKQAWVARVVAWVVLAASMVPLISFSFVLAPLVYSTIFILWPWQVVWKRPSACC